MQSMPMVPKKRSRIGAATSTVAPGRASAGRSDFHSSSVSQSTSLCVSAAQASGFSR